MAGKKDKAVISVITGLTSKQAAKITQDIMKSKADNAPLSRGTIATRNESSIGHFLSEETKNLLGKSN